MLIGAAVAQVPKKSTATLSVKQRASIGALASIFPDIDYLLFFLAPLDFLAYWHRAETHSLILAPFWAWMLATLIRRYCAWPQQRALIFWICLIAILSHDISDSLTTFGTQWFAPISDHRVSFNLLFVMDGYFTLTIIIALMLLVRWRNPARSWLAFVVPASYLAFVLMLKLAAYLQLPTLEEQTNTRERMLLPQPFSPFYWHIIDATAQGYNQAYMALTKDMVGAKLSEMLNAGAGPNHYQKPNDLSWNHYSILPADQQARQEARQVWQHKKFQAFREFAVYPVFHAYQTSANNTCVWFSDLRYHWPTFLPSFRFGMCRSGTQTWQLYRIKYFSSVQTEPID